MNFFKKRLNKKGFTLVELLIVIAVLGIIAGIGVNSMSSVTDTFKERADEKTGEIIARNVEVLVLAGDVTVSTDTTKEAFKTLMGDVLEAKPQMKDSTVFSVTGLAAGSGDHANEIVVTISNGVKNDFTYYIAKDKVE